MNISEKASYVKGLISGLELDESKKETKVINTLVDLIGDIASEVTELGFAYDDLCDQVDAVDEDLASIEEVVFEDECCCHDDCDCEDDMFEITCPSCNKTMILSENEVANGEMKCIGCGEKLEFDISESLDDKAE